MLLPGALALAGALSAADELLPEIAEVEIDGAVRTHADRVRVRLRTQPGARYDARGGR